MPRALMQSFTLDTSDESFIVYKIRMHFVRSDSIRHLLTQKQNSAIVFFSIFRGYIEEVLSIYIQ